MSNGDAHNIGDRPADPSAASAPSSDAEDAIALAGYWDGSRRLYLTPDQSAYLEFPPEAVRSFGDVAPGQFPFLGEQATWVTFNPDAQIEYVRTGPAAPDDEFAVEVRLRSSASEISSVLKPPTGYRCPSRPPRCTPVPPPWWPEDPYPYPYPFFP